MIDRNQIECFVSQASERGVGAVGNLHLEPAPSEGALGQTAQAVVVVDIEDSRSGY
jgi:hypothetical protein